MTAERNVRNIGISAHIDSGKTTLTERILYYTGRIHAMHEVRGRDGVGATMDSMDLEREKGITIQSAATYCEWGETHVNIIDTPGHVDFTVEVERALRVLDGAILVLDSVAGVQSQSITVDRQMRRYGVPRLAFINKMDRRGGNPWRVARMLEDKLGHRPLVLQMPIGLEDAFCGIIDLVEMRAYAFEGENGETRREIPIPEEHEAEALERREALVERCGDFCDEIAEAFLEGRHVTACMLKRVIRQACVSLTATPVFIGSALRNKGVQLLLDGVVDYLPDPSEVANPAFDADGREVLLSADPEAPMVALAYKLEDGSYGQLTYLRIYQGSLSKGDFIENVNRQNRRSKVPRLIRMHSNEMEDIERAVAGDIVAVFGIDCHSGDTFTDGKLQVTLSGMHVPEPVISVAIHPSTKKSEEIFAKAMNRFTKEDPTLRVTRDEESGQTLMSGMGELHLDIYLERLKREYKCEVEVGAPQVAYRESITHKAEFSYTHKKQTGGKGQFARVMGYVEPLPAGAIESYEFVDDTRGGSIPREYIPSCDKGFREAIKEGSLIGFPVEGVRVVIDDGSFHAVDSSDQAFRTAALAAFREIYSRAQPAILEPIMKVEVQVPAEFQGAVFGGLNQRRGVIIGTEKSTGDDYVTGAAEVPLSEMFGYATDLRSATQGRGEFTMEFLKYAPVPRSIAETLIAEHQKRRAAA